MSSSSTSVALDAEPLYSAEQIKIPDELPDILKEWTKEAIKVQPADLLKWSAE